MTDKYGVHTDVYIYVTLLQVGRHKDYFCPFIYKKYF